jgi:hypothetical protein
MNEHSYIKAIHNRLPSTVYKWKINDNFHGGVADAYYSGDGGDLWIEYKYLSNPPKRPTTEIKTCLTDQQLYWLKSRQSEGRNVALVIGIAAPFGYKFKDNLIITDFSQKITLESFSSSAIDKRGVASYIMNAVSSNIETDTTAI